MLQKPLVLLCKTHRGFFEASSRLRRGFQKPLVLLCKTHRGFIEAPSRLHRGFQKTLVLLCKTHRGFIEAFENHLFYCAKLIEASSRLSKTLALLCDAHRGFLEALRDYRWSTAKLVEALRGRRPHGALTARIKECCADINRSLDVEGLCKGFPKRVQMVLAAKGHH